MFYLLLIAGRNLLQHRRRTLLLGGVLALITCLLVLLVGLYAGIQRTLLDSATTLMSGHVNVAGYFKVTRGQSAPVLMQREELQALVRREVPELDFTLERGRGVGKMISDARSMTVALNGIDVAAESALRRVLRLQSGKLEDLTRPDSVLIFASQAKKLHLSVGDQVTLLVKTLRGSYNTLDGRIVAIAQDVGLLSATNVFVSNETLRSVYQLNPESTGVLLLFLKDVEQAPKVEERLRRALSSGPVPVLEPLAVPFWEKIASTSRDNRAGQELDLSTWEDEVAFVSWTSTLLRALGIILMVILLAVVAIGITNTLVIAIRERTPEIGTLRAVGMQRTGVVAMFLWEALLLGFSATLFGSLVGAGLCALLNRMELVAPSAVQLFLMRDTLWLAVDAKVVAASLLLITAFTTAVAALPCLRAARLKPITAIQQVG